MKNHDAAGSRSFTRIQKGIVVVGSLLIVAFGLWMAAGRGQHDPAGMEKQQDGMAGMNMSADGGVRLTASQISRFGVTFDTVRIDTLERELRATGSIALDETKINQITPRFGGFLERLYVNSMGQPVRRGQPVAAIFSPELIAAQQELLLAAGVDRSVTANSVPGAAGQTGLLASARGRLRLWDISDAEIDAILRSGRPRRTLTLYSSADGVVTEKNVVQGQSVSAGMPLMTIADISTVWVITEVREADAHAARIGAAASVEVNAFPGERITGRVSYVYPMLETSARSIRVRIVLPNPGGRLKPGMFATVMLTSPQPAALVVPEGAVIETGEKSIVFVRSRDGSFLPHEVIVGRRGSGLVQIVSGLTAGQVVVTSAQFLLESESNISEVMRSMLGQGRGAMPGMEETGSMPGVTEKGADMKGMKMPAAPRR